MIAHSNTGNLNTGDLNTGNRNTGNRNTGSGNTGDLNTGGWNTGDLNTGSWNTCDFEIGFFNTVESEEVRVFNSSIKKCEWVSYKKPDFLYFDMTCWVDDSKMTEEEKRDNPKYKDIGGYLKEYGYKEAFKKSWDNADKEDRMKILDCPNFDNDIFLEISGIDVNKDLLTKKVTIELTEDQLEKIKHLI